MAIVQLENVEVTTVHQSGNGVKVAEHFEIDGNPRRKIYTLWFDEPSGLNVGEIISVSGLLGTKVRSWTDQQSGEERYGVELSVNKPRIATRTPAQQTQQAPQASGWGNMTQNNVPSERF